MSTKTKDRRTEEPEDPNRRWIAPTPADVREATADREMADAERAVAVGTAVGEQATRVAAMGTARTQEQRRSIWLGED